jgi:hypothetical protein
MASKLPARPPRPSILQWMSLVVVVVVGLAIAASKVFAKGPAAAPSSSAAVLPGGPSISLPVPSALPGVAPSVSPEPAKPAASAAAAAGSSAPIDYAVVQDESDLPKGLSPEELDAIGTGKVPIHREGPFRSPFAHPRFGGPTTAKVGLVLVQVRDYSIQSGTFDADFFLSLTGDKELPALEPTFTNAKDVNLTTVADTPTFKLYRVTASFKGTVDLRTYPFDEQRLPIDMEDLKAGVDQVVFVPDPNRTSLDEGFSVPGWNISKLGARAFKHVYPTRFDRDDLYVSRYRFELAVDRFGVSAALSVFVPALVIVLISLTGMWIPFNLVDVRSNTGAPMLAAAVLFHYALIQSLPATGYLTRADKLMLGTYASLLLNMGSTWIMFMVREDRIASTFRTARWLVPVVTVIIMAVAAVA